MSSDHPFRFAAAVPFTAPETWIETARRMEALGYTTVVSSDHPSLPGAVDPLGALLLAAAATTRLRVGTHVLVNDFRHPVLLAQQAVLLDTMSGGRFELGLGTGSLRDDYTALGIAYDQPGARVGRLEEAIILIKRLLREESVTFAGAHYRVDNVRLTARPARQPQPRLFIGGGGKRILSLAGREADIVSFDPKGTAAGPKDLATATPAALAQQISWVREAAGPRFAALELHLLVYAVAVTEQRHTAAEAIVQGLGIATAKLHDQHGDERRRGAGITAVPHRQRGADRRATPAAPRAVRHLVHFDPVRLWRFRRHRDVQPGRGPLEWELKRVSHSANWNCSDLVQLRAGTCTIVTGTTQGVCV